MSHSSPDMKKAIIYIRYILPSVTVLAVILCAFLPLVSFELEMNPLERRSLAVLMRDAWQQCRSYLSDPMVTKDSATTAFVWRTVAGLVLSLAGAVAALGLTAFTGVMSVRILALDPTAPEASALKLRLRRVLPGGGWLAAAQLLIFIPVLFPYWLGVTYTDTLYLQTTAQSGLTAVALVLTALSLMGAVLTRGIEREMRLDVFTVYAARED